MLAPQTTEKCFFLVRKCRRGGFIALYGYTLRTKGSRRVLPERLRFYPEPFASKEHFLKKGSRVLCKSRGSIKNLFIQRTPFGRKKFFVKSPEWVLDKTLGIYMYA